MSKKLLVRPNPFPDESLLGYIARLSEVNGYSSPKDILKLFQSSKYQLISNLPKRIDRDLTPLMELTGKSFSTLEPMIYTHLYYKNKYKFLSSEVSFRIIEPCRPKFCPFCLQEKSYYRIVWDFSLVTVCPAHKCLLISNCPECNSKLDIYRNGFGKCKCGFDLREIQVVEELPDNELRVTEHVHLLLGLETSRADMIPSHNPLINFSLDEFSLLIDYFSKLALKMYDLEYVPNYRELSNSNLHFSLSKALSIFDNFPENYLLFVEEQIKAPCFAKSNHDYSAFSRYYPSLHNATEPSGWSFIYKAFIENIYPLLEKNSIIARRKRYVPLSNYISIAEAEKNLKVTKKEFKFLLSTEQLKVERLAPYEKDFLFVNSKSYLAIKSGKLTWVKDDELASQLEIRSELVRELAYDGYLPIKMQGYSAGEDYYYFEGDLFIKLLTGLRSRIKNKCPLNRDKLLDFEEIEETLNPDIRLLSNFVGLCFKGKIKARQELLDKDGIRRFLFAEKDVEKFIEVFL
jgi:hypothetical protein